MNLFHSTISYNLVYSLENHSTFSLGYNTIVPIRKHNTITTTVKMVHSTGVTVTSEQGGGRAQTEASGAARRLRLSASGPHSGPARARSASFGSPATCFHEQNNKTESPPSRRRAAPALFIRALEIPCFSLY